MKERIYSHIPMAEGLTPEGQSSYARNGEIYTMPDGSSVLVDRFGRPIGGEGASRLVDKDGMPLTDTPKIDIPATTPEQIRAKAAWLRAYRGEWPIDPDERQSLGGLIQRGEMPPPEAMGSGAGDLPDEEEDDEATLARLMGETSQGVKGRKKESSLEKAFRQPENFNEILEAIPATYPEFSADGAYPLIDRETGKVNDANFVRFVRSRMLYLEDEAGADGAVNHWTEVGIPFGNGEINLQRMFALQTRFFRDKDGQIHVELANQLRREIFARKIARDRDISYRKGGNGMGDDEGLPNQMRAMFQDNNFTKNLWNGKSLWYWTLEMPLELKGGIEPDTKNQDTRLGRSIATSLAVYYNIADFTKLQEMLGKKSRFFTREAFEEARRDLAKGDIASEPFRDVSKEVEGKRGLEQDYISDEDLDKMFAGGKVNPEMFIKFMNLFPDAQPDPRRERLIKRMVRIAVRDKYDLYQKNADGKILEDGQTTEYAETFAYSMVRWTGIAARNDLGAAAYDAQAKILRTQNYRFKQADEKRGGAFGNQYNVGLFKALGVNYLDSIITEDGILLRQVVEKLARVGVDDTEEREEDDPYNHAVFSPEWTAKMESRLEEIANKDITTDDEEEEARDILASLAFKNLTEQNYINNGVARWFKEYDSFILGKELHLDGIVKYAKMQGYVYEPDKFASAIQEGYLKPLRYGYSTWKIKYDTNVRDMVPFNAEIHEGMPFVEVGSERIKGSGDNRFVFNDMPIARSMFGMQLLDTDHFWKEVPLVDKNGNTMLDKNGKPIMNKIEHLLDPKKMADNPTQLFKQMALARVAADIQSHRRFDSPYPRWDAETVHALLAALERVPGDLLVDETDLKNTVMPKTFFSHHDIEWLKSIAGVTDTEVLVKEGGWRASKSVGKSGVKFVKTFLKALK